ncbi:hypothetical protein MTP10_24240 [Nonomuraea sp. 3-1Str]|uniref:hypothetical protein n=1 Tax=Nonomuraea sp. 3-1Str TaxID=2929801 RepID=UPI002856E2D8|nr:hypothetical protein [Nonomuraea sp. 3-1Str]MDR8411833.1 hypothetical protein [Nonomuraea sp. 3-1Str]
MPRRHLLSTPALLVAGGYLVALAVAAVIALTAGDLGVLSRVTLSVEAGEDVAATWPNVLALVPAGMAVAWALWQGLRGPLAGPPPELDRDTRWLRVALYAAAASWLLFPLMASWPWWAAVLDTVVMSVLVLRFHPVLARDLAHADRVRAVGVVGYGGAAAAALLVVLDVPVPGLLPVICGLAALIWTVLVLRAQRRDGRWQPATVRYGIVSVVLALAAPLIGLLPFGPATLLDAAAVIGGALGMVWLARSAHDLADPRHQPAPHPSTAM